MVTYHIEKNMIMTKSPRSKEELEAAGATTLFGAPNENECVSKPDLDSLTVLHQTLFAFSLTSSISPTM